jgi:hypothetical protein
LERAEERGKAPDIGEVLDEFALLVRVKLGIGLSMSPGHTRMVHNAIFVNFGVKKFIVKNTQKNQNFDV